MTAKELSEQYEQYVIGLRREFHSHPELSCQEEHTSARIAAELRRSGIPYEIVGDRSVVGLVDTGRPGKALVLRADFDALPLTEQTDVPWKSTVPGVMHACGHDAHAACLLGTARALETLKRELSGRVYLCFQIGEEAGAGAHELVDYLQRRGDVSGAVGMHVAGNLEPGTAELRPGARLAGLTVFSIEIHGVGGHGARPDLAVDPIKAAVAVYQRLISIPVNEHSLFDTCVVSPCCLQAGSRYNIIPESAHLEGTIRFYKPGDGDRLLEQIRRVCALTCAAYGCTAEVTGAAHVPYPLVNDPAATAVGRAVAQQIGLTLIDDLDPGAGSDNFAEFLAAFPGFYLNLGAHSARPGTSGNHHNPTFDLDESVLKKGMEFFLTYAQQFLG